MVGRTCRRGSFVSGLVVGRTYWVGFDYKVVSGEGYWKPLGQRFDAVAVVAPAGAAGGSRCLPLMELVEE